jgi:TP901 family phage tail tape measure protein
MGLDSVFKLSVVLGMIDNLTSPLSSATSSVTDSTKKLNDALGTVQKAGTALAGVGTGVVTACLATVQSTFDTQDALGELSSLGVTDLEAVESAAKSFSDTWAGTTKSDFITAAYDIKSGIASLTDEGVAQFTELAALTGKATKSTTEEMGSLFATGYGIYKGAYEDMSDLEFGEMFSAGISTAVKNYKTAGSEMASSISALGATATNNNVSLEEQLAILGQLQTTMSGSEAATKYKAFLNKAAEAGDALGLSFVDANNQLLSTPEILEKLQSKYGDTIDAVEKQEIKAAFGTDEAVAMIDLLYNDIGGLSSGIDAMAESMKQGTSVTEEMAEAIQNTPAQKFTVLKQQIHNNVEELGNGLLPAVNETMDKVSGLIEKGSEWISNNQETVSTIMNIALRLGVVLLILGSVIGIAGSVGKAILGVRNTITEVKSAWTVLSAAFTASPVGLVIVGIVALVAIITVLWNKCEGFRNFWSSLFGQIKRVLQDAWATLGPALQNARQKLQELFEAIKPILEIIGVLAAAIGIVILGPVVALAAAIGALAVTIGTAVLGTIVGTIDGIIAALTPLTNAFSDIVSFITNVVNAIKAIFMGDFSGACDYLSAAVDNVRDFFIDGFDAILSFAGGFADGFLDMVGNVLNIFGIDASGAIENVKNTISNGLNAVKGFFGNIMGAAADTAKEKLANIKKAYEENGGGISGVVAASQEAVKGYFTAGLTFVDKLTGGKLSALRDKFTGKFDEIRTKLADKVEKIKSIFDFEWSLPELKIPTISVTGGEAPFGIAGKGSLPKFDIQWNAEGGILTKPTIFGSSDGKLLGGGEAGDEAVLPLSTLWEKLKTFIHDETDGDDDGNSTVPGKIISELVKKDTSTLESKEITVKESEIRELRSGEEKRNTIIQKVDIRIDMSKLKDLPILQKLIDEIKDAQNSTDTVTT